MTIEQQKETSPKFREIGWVSNQVKEELKRFNKERFYEKDGDEIKYNMDIVEQYLGVLKEKKTWRELVSKNSSAMVMAVQIALYSQNYTFGTVDGILGEKTKTAIRKFQSDNNLPVDTLGRSMPSTIEKLLEVISREDKVEIPEEEKQEAQEIMGEKENKNEINLDEGDVSNTKEDKIFENEKTNKENHENNLNKIKIWAKSPRRESHNFRTLTTITLTEAKAIHWDEENEQEIGYSYLLPLSGVKEVTPEIFEELLKHKGVLEIGIENLTPGLAQKIVDQETTTNIGENIIFSGLKSINSETCEILGNTKGILTLNSIEAITQDEMGKLIRNPGGRIYLDSINEITPSIAREIVKSPREIYLNGITNIDLATAKELSKKTTGKVHLEQLEVPLSNEILDELIKIPTRNLVLRKYNEITPIFKQLNDYKKQKEESEI